PSSRRPSRLGRRSCLAQSYPSTLSTAVGASPTILYSTVTDLSRPLRPGASFGVVFPPAFRTPIPIIVSSGRLSHPRTTFLISTSAPSTPILICLTSFAHRLPSLLIVTP